MAKAAEYPVSEDLNRIDWLSRLQGMAYAYGKPRVIGRVKKTPDHFIVTEVMDIEPSGDGEHYWLDISKVRVNTESVAKSLARFSGVPNRDVGYSGMKDFQAITRQWFSVWKPKGESLDWSDYNFNGVTINQVVKHTRKIRRGTHIANRFEIRVVDLEGVKDIEGTLSSKLRRIQETGVPNYFGEQRFGRQANNLQQALDMFVGKKRVKDRSLRGILLSSARSWLFNCVISARINAGTWQSLYAGEPANLNGSNSVFSVVDVDAENTRLIDLDIHPTAPMWGEKNKHLAQMSAELVALEHSAMSDYEPFMLGLERARVEYQRRAIRLVPGDLQWRYEQNDLCLSFELQKGQFATSILRELVWQIL